PVAKENAAPGLASRCRRMKPVGSVTIRPSDSPDRAHCLVPWSAAMMTAASARTASTRRAGLVPDEGEGGGAGAGELAVLTPAPVRGRPRAGPAAVCAAARPADP